MTSQTSSRRALGIDFGTTNSALAIVNGDGIAQLAHFATEHGTTDTFRSILYFDPTPVRGAMRKDGVAAGPEAIRRYRQAAPKGRFIQSLKTYLGDSSFTGTQIGGKQRSLEELIGLILQRLLAAGTEALGPLPARAIVGRPVHFTTARSAEDDDLALRRLRTALGYAGITEPVFEYEPVAAAYAYRQRLETAGHRADRRLRRRHQRLLDPRAAAAIGGGRRGHHHPRQRRRGHRRRCLRSR